MRYRNPGVGMGGSAAEREYSVTVTDEAAVARHHRRRPRLIRAAARRAAVVDNPHTSGVHTSGR